MLVGSGQSSAKNVYVNAQFKVHSHNLMGVKAVEAEHKYVHILLKYAHVLLHVFLFF